MLDELPDAFIFMKVGNHAGETFDQILQRKMREKEDAGRIFWGYGGPTCHPLTGVQPFAKKHGNLHVLMEPIDSKADPDILQPTEYSADGVTWKPMPDGISVTGSRYALVLDQIRPGDLEVRTDDFVVDIGPNRGKVATEYLRGRVDKACLTRASVPATRFPELSPRNIRYVAKLIEPYAVLLRRSPSP